MRAIGRKQALEQTEERVKEREGKNYAVYVKCRDRLIGAT